MTMVGTPIIPNAVPTIDEELDTSGAQADDDTSNQDIDTNSLFSFETKHSGRGVERSSSVNYYKKPQYEHFYDQQIEPLKIYNKRQSAPPQFNYMSDGVESTGFDGYLADGETEESDYYDSLIDEVNAYAMANHN